MRRDYELTILLRVEANEEALNGQIDEVKNWVEAGELGTVNRIDRWGRRRLAYEIDRQREGIYILMDSSLESAGLDELERNLRLAPNVLRYLIVRKDE